MFKPLDVSMLHVRAKAWAEKIHIGYYSKGLEHNPEKIGGQDATVGVPTPESEGLQPFAGDSTDEHRSPGRGL